MAFGTITTAFYCTTIDRISGIGTIDELSIIYNNIFHMTSVPDNIDLFTKNDVRIGVRKDNIPLPFINNQKKTRLLMIALEDKTRNVEPRILQEICGFNTAVHEVLQTNFPPALEIGRSGKGNLDAAVVIPAHVRRYPLISQPPYCKHTPLFRARPFLHQDTAWLTLFHEIGHLRALMLSSPEDIGELLVGRERVKNEMHGVMKMGRSIRPKLQKRARRRAAEAFYVPEIQGWVQGLKIVERLQKEHLNPDGNLSRSEATDFVFLGLGSYREALERVYGIGLPGNDTAVLETIKKAYPLP